MTPEQNERLVKALEAIANSSGYLFPICVFMLLLVMSTCAQVGYHQH